MDKTDRDFLVQQIGHSKQQVRKGKRRLAKTLSEGKTEMHTRFVAMYGRRAEAFERILAVYDDAMADRAARVTPPQV